MKYHSFGWGFITGVSLGFEFPETDIEGITFMLIVDLFIIRLVFQNYLDDNED